MQHSKIKNTKVLDDEHNQTTHWSAMHEAGTLMGMRLVYWLYCLFGRRVFSLVMYPVALYFVLFRHQQRRASLQFLCAHYRVHPSAWRRKPNYWHVLLHFKSFAEVILDKLLGWLIDIDENNFILSDPDLIESLLADPSTPRPTFTP